MARKKIDAANLRAGGTGLDFGSGVVGTAVYIAAVSGAKVVGISNNEWLSAQARQYAAEQGMRGRAAWLTVGDEDCKSLVAWPDGSLDIVSFYESVSPAGQGRFFAAAFWVLESGACLVGATGFGGRSASTGPKSRSDRCRKSSLFLSSARWDE